VVAVLTEMLVDVWVSSKAPSVGASALVVESASHAPSFAE